MTVEVKSQFSPNGCGIKLQYFGKGSHTIYNLSNNPIVKFKISSNVHGRYCHQSLK